jgi:hypothetical protein
VLRLEASTDVEPIDIPLLVAASTALADRWRTLPFGADGALDHPEHGRREGLAVVAGAHPRRGTRYRLVTDLSVDPDRGQGRLPDDEPVEPAEPLVVELVADDRRELRFRSVDTAQPVEVALTDPTRPGSLQVQVEGTVDDEGLACELPEPLTSAEPSGPAPGP